MIRVTRVDHSMFLHYRVNSGDIATFELAWLGYKQ